MILNPTIVEDSGDPPQHTQHTHTQLYSLRSENNPVRRRSRQDVCLLKNKIEAIDVIHLLSQIRLVNVMLAEVQEQQRPSFHCLGEINRQLSMETAGSLLVYGDDLERLGRKHFC